MLIYVEHINNKQYIKMEIYHYLYILKMRMLILNGVRVFQGVKKGKQISDYKIIVQRSNSISIHKEKLSRVVLTKH